MRELILLQNETVLLQSASGFLLQNSTLLLQNVMFITNSGSTINHNITAWMKAP